jgi:DNA-directed RNA polymerase specialized sigma24 family protein
MDVEDIEQDLFCAICDAFPKYNESRSSLETFLEIVLLSRVKNYIRDRLNQKRGSNTRLSPLDEDKTPDFNNFRSPALLIDTDRALKSLTLYKQIIVLMMRRHTLSQISALFQIPYGQLYTLIQKIHREITENTPTNKETIMLQPLENLTAQQISKLQIDDLTQLYNLINTRLAEAKTMKEKMDDGLNLRFSSTLQKEMQNQSKNTGTVHFWENNFKITADVPKKVVWNSEKIEEVMKPLPESLQKQIVKTSYSVDERMYQTLPQQYKEMLAPARTVTTGKVRYQISLKNQ